jgi:hypothetical protein
MIEKVSTRGEEDKGGEGGNILQPFESQYGTYCSVMEQLC